MSLNSQVRSEYPCFATAIAAMHTLRSCDCRSLRRTHDLPHGIASLLLDFGNKCGRHGRLGQSESFAKPAGLKGRSFSSSGSHKRPRTRHGHLRRHLLGRGTVLRRDVGFSRVARWPVAGALHGATLAAATRGKECVACSDGFLKIP